MYKRWKEFRRIKKVRSPLGAAVCKSKICIISGGGHLDPVHILCMASLSEDTQHSVPFFTDIFTLKI